jgi:hypothetical protein
MRSGSELSLRWEWEPADAVRSAELRATWARLEIWIGSDCVTLVEDQESQSTRRSIYVSLYPLAEWISYNWWLLRADARPTQQLIPTATRSVGVAARASALAYRHNVRSAGDGFWWPDLVLIPEGQTTRTVWRRDRGAPPSSPIRFIGQGEAFLDKRVVESALSSFVEAVLTRLSEQGVRQTALETEWNALKETDEEEAQFCLAAARLGLDPYAEAAELESEILRAADQLGGEVFEDFADAVDPRRIGAGLEWIAEARSLIEAGSNGSNSTLQRLRVEMRQAAPAAPGDRPWERGWQQAGRLRQLLRVPADDAFDLSRLIEPAVRSTTDHGLQAAGGGPRAATPIVVLSRSQSEELSRFTLARGLWRSLSNDDPLFLVTAAHTDKQKIERAFAAELLAPAQGVSQRLGDNVDMVTMEDLEPVARHFHVSPMVVQHQIENQLTESIFA